MQTGANAGRLLCSYLSAKPLLMVPQMRSHSWLIPPLQYVLIASGFTSLSKRSERYLRSASRRVNLTACCHQEEVWLPCLPPGPADWVLGNHSPGVAGACGTLLWSDLITNTTRNVFTFFFFALWAPTCSPGATRQEDGACTWGQRVKVVKATGPPSFGVDELLDQLLYNAHH